MASTADSHMTSAMFQARRVTERRLIHCIQMHSARKILPAADLIWAFTSIYSKYDDLGLLVQVCMYFMAGHCAFGSQCRYAHVRPDGTTLEDESQAIIAPRDGGQHAASGNNAAQSTQDTQNGRQGISAAPEQDVRGALPPGGADAAWEDEAPGSSHGSQPSNRASAAARGQDCGGTAHSSQPFKGSPILRSGQPLAMPRPLHRQSSTRQKQVHSGLSTGTQRQGYDQLNPMQTVLRELREVCAQLSSTAPAAARSRELGQHDTGLARGAQAEQQGAWSNPQHQDYGSAAGSRSYEPAEQATSGELGQEMEPGREPPQSLSDGAWLAAGDSHDEGGCPQYRWPAGITKSSAYDEEQAAGEDSSNGAVSTYHMWQQQNSLQDRAGLSYKDWLAAEADKEDDGTAYEEWLVANDFTDNQEGWVQHCMEAVLGQGQHVHEYGNGFHHSYDCDSYQSEAGFGDGPEEDYRHWQVGIPAHCTPGAPNVLFLEAQAQMRYFAWFGSSVRLVLSWERD